MLCYWRCTRTRRCCDLKRATVNAKTAVRVGVRFGIMVGVRYIVVVNEFGSELGQG